MAVSSLALPPRLEKQGPTLATLHMVERVLRRSGTPLSLNKIKERLPRKMAHSTLREAIEHYKRLGCLVEGSKGVMWIENPGPAFWKAVETWERR